MRAPILLYLLPTKLPPTYLVVPDFRPLLGRPLLGPSRPLFQILVSDLRLGQPQGPKSLEVKCPFCESVNGSGSHKAPIS